MPAGRSDPLRKDVRRSPLPDDFSSGVGYFGLGAPNGQKASEISARSERFFEAAAAENLHLAKFRYPASLLRGVWKDVDLDQPQVVCLRSCLMKPEHEDWADRLWEILDRTAGRIG